MRLPLRRFTLLSALAMTLWATRLRADTISIDSGTTYQTVRGWGCLNALPSFLTPEFREELLYEMVNEYGLNRVRFEIPAGSKINDYRWEFLNDNTDPTDTDWSALNLTGLDALIQEFVGPFSDMVRANGEPFDMYVSPSFYDRGSTGAAPDWLYDNPGENAEFAMSLLLRLKYVYGIESDYYCILNEAGYLNSWDVDIVQDNIKALGPQMEAAGLSTKIEFPESVNPATAMTFVNATSADDEMWSWVGLVSYHRYGDNSPLAQLADFAAGKGLPTAFTENATQTLDQIYEDLTVGNVSYWDVYNIGTEIKLFDWPTNYNQLIRKGDYWRLRQIMHYVRPGAVRVGVTTDSGTAKMLAWEHHGKTILNFYNQGGDLDIEGLTPGTYGFCGARPSESYVEFGLQTVGADGRLTLANLDSSRIHTLYPHPGGNLPPVFTDFIGPAGYLRLPDSSFAMKSAAQDPELDPISYRWDLTKAPGGAPVVLDTPNAADCSASGLTVPGDYAFSITAGDATGSTQREVRIQVFADNPAPVVWELHNRIPVIVTLPDGGTTLRSSSWDLNGDPLTTQWSITSQPAGADALLSTPTTANCNVTNMTVAGDYVFRMTVNDGNSSDYAEHTVTVYPLNTKPTLNTEASPNALALPNASTLLTSISSDDDGDSLTHWWQVTGAPAGARPVLATPGQADTTVSGLIVPGTYTFRHLVADASESQTSSVDVTVSAGGSPQLFFVSTPRGGETYEPGQTIGIRWSSANFSGNVKLEFYDGTSWSDILASTADDGIEYWTVPAGAHRNCRIRVSDASDGVPSDQSDAGFRILGPSEFEIIEISGQFATGPTVSWTGLPGGYAYQVYYSDSLLPDDWLPIGPVRTANAGTLDLSYTDASAIGQVCRFYRIERTLTLTN